MLTGTSERGRVLTTMLWLPETSRHESRDRPAKCCSFDSLRAHYGSRSTSLPRLGVGEPSRKTGQERRALRARRTRSCAALNSTHWRRNRSRVVFDSERSQRRCV